MSGLGRALVAGLCAAGWMLAAAQLAVPPLRSWVTDQTQTLTPAQRMALEAQLVEIEQRTGSQIAVLLVASTQSEPIEQFSLRVAEAWKLGRDKARAQRDTGQAGAAAIDDGILIVVARADRRIRIEVGYGLEGVVPDAIAKRIITEIMAPAFRAGQDAAGLSAAVSALAQQIAGAGLPPPRRAPPAQDAPSVWAIVVTGTLIGFVLAGLVGRRLGALVGGVAAGWWALGSVASWAIALLVGVGVVVAVGVAGGATAGRSLRRVGHHTWGPGPWRGGGWGGGGGLGGFGGGGGGGGGFGGGGASGGW